MARRRSLLGRVARIAVGAVAVVFATVVYAWITTPDVRALRSGPPPETAFMRLRRAEAEAAGRTPRITRRWAPYGQISPALKRAVLVTEDAAFWEHDGLDYHEIRASLERGLFGGGRLRGASTITQQLAKNLYLSPSRNPYRKLRELFITRRLEAELTKVRILELYLNVIEWGDGIWGAEAAARAYFGIPASALNADQAALMAAAIFNPRELNPAQPTRRLVQRQQMILRRMGDMAPPGGAASDTTRGGPAGRGIN
jgi:monofunctional biosynthetic peptidoglycan transglycosylase